MSKEKKKQLKEATNLLGLIFLGATGLGMWIGYADLAWYALIGLMVCLSVRSFVLS
jgi:hypothetical protein